MNGSRVLRRGVAALLLLGVGSFLGVAVGRAADETSPANLEKLRRAVAQHPDDPDLAWAWIRSLSRAGYTDVARERLEAFRRRWPRQRPEADRLLGRLHLESGRDREALQVLNPYVAQHPEDGVALYYRGLALRGLGRDDEAQRELARARSLAPGLASEILVLQAVDRIGAGDVRAGRNLLEEALALDPDSDVASQARQLLLGSSSAPSRRRFELDAQAGFEYDSNVTLDSGLDLAGLPRDERDTRAVWGAGVRWSPLEGERLALTAGYHYDESAHDSLDAYDLRSHFGYASMLYRVAEGAALRLDGRFSSLELGGEGYESSYGLQPNLFLASGLGGGILRAWGDFELARYADEPLLPSLERDGFRAGGGIEHTLPLRRWTRRWGAAPPGGVSRPAWLATAVSYDRTDTRADRDVFGFAGAYDFEHWAGRLRFRLPLPGRFEAVPSFQVGYEHYFHRNVIDFLTDDGVGTSDPRVRRDTVIEGRLALVRPIGHHVEIEVGWRGTRRISNVDLYDYRRQIMGLTLRATSR